MNQTELKKLVGQKSVDWIKDGMKEDPQLIIDRLGLLIHGNVTHALNAYRTDKISSTPPK